MSSSAYSLVEHLAKSIWFSRWQKGWLGMFSAYFDASGQEEQVDVRFLSIGGFFAPANVWADMETQWKEALARKSIPEFHMADCANYRYEFNGWQARESERQELLHDLMDIIKSLSRRFSCTIQLDAYRDNLINSRREQYDFKAYVIAGRGCAARLKNWLNEEHSPNLCNVQLFFESGDNWQPQLRQRLIDDGYPEPLFKPKRDRYSQKTGELIEHGLIPFQAADICAYMMNLLAKNMIAKQTNHWGDKENIHWVLSELEGMVGQATTLDAKGINGIEKLLEVCEVDLLNTSDGSVSSSLVPDANSHSV